MKLPFSNLLVLCFCGLHILWGIAFLETALSCISKINMLHEYHRPLPQANPEGDCAITNLLLPRNAL